MLEQLRALDTGTVSNAIEQFDVRLRNEGFTHILLKCLSPLLPPMVGYAVTARIRTFDAPAGHHCYHHRMDFWEYVAKAPAPRIFVFEDVDSKPAFAATFGELGTQIGVALGCIGCVTNGAVRDLPEIEQAGFHLYARGVSPSHAYAHIVDFDVPVKVGGMSINPEELLHGDRHGVISVPKQIASQIPEVAAGVLAQERELIELCQSPNFSMAALRHQIERTSYVAK